eukprot:CAMPEP_0204842512 /NCGR_PEP_ID=MMETSP1346-20131115/46715_1 /ASSEMBLY_ACC=CAM_ASM_000771 /TAXON_ID=215587 /ORGANISM="Aplanochytrium stocchinoi, Strain GSBS06" /LENGTH=105 /DNA_ID=CAMNT_0051981385 /DNA_START=137 /DNA_END=451 /DNA_ORIENTATION=-
MSRRLSLSLLALTLLRVCTYLNGVVVLVAASDNVGNGDVVNSIQQLQKEFISEFTSDSVSDATSSQTGKDNDLVTNEDRNSKERLDKTKQKLEVNNSNNNNNNNK